LLYNIDMYLIPLFVFIFGLIIGSFLNVVILRINTGRSIVKGRSKCAVCSRELAWYELVPVFSFLALGGKCGNCKNQISFQYIFVELATAITFVVAYTKTVIAMNFTPVSWFVFAFALAVASLLIVIFVYDYKHKIIPDKVVYPFILLGVVAVVFRFFTDETYFVAKALLESIAVALPFFLFWFISRGRFMGFGDVKLALGMGLLLGVKLGFAAILLSFWIGGIVGLFLIALSKKYKLDSQIPFAPFMIIAMFIVGFWHLNLGALFPFSL
jgi:leader peptidase (prepilin peptidase) / N-methyltransferase